MFRAAFRACDAPFKMAVSAEKVLKVVVCAGQVKRVALFGCAGQRIVTGEEMGSVTAGDFEKVRDKGEGGGEAGFPAEEKDQ